MKIQSVPTILLLVCIIQISSGADSASSHQPDQQLAELPFAEQEARGRCNENLCEWLARRQIDQQLAEEEMQLETDDLLQDEALRNMFSRGICEDTVKRTLWSVRRMRDLLEEIADDTTSNQHHVLIGTMMALHELSELQEKFQFSPFWSWMKPKLLRQNMLKMNQAGSSIQSRVLHAMGIPENNPNSELPELRGIQQTLIQMSREVQQDLLNGEEYRWKSVFLESLWEDMVKSGQLPPWEEYFEDFGSDTANAQAELPFPLRNLRELVKDHGLVLIHPEYFDGNHLLSREYCRTWTEEWRNWMSRWDQIDVNGILKSAIVRTKAKLLTDVLDDGNFAVLSNRFPTKFDLLWETIQELVRSEDADQLLEDLLQGLFESDEGDDALIFETKSGVLEAGGFDAQSPTSAVPENKRSDPLFLQSLVRKWRENLAERETQRQIEQQVPVQEPSDPQDQCEADEVVESIGNLLVRRVRENALQESVKRGERVHQLLKQIVDDTTSDQDVDAALKEMSKLQEKLQFSPFWSLMKLKMLRQFLLEMTMNQSDPSRQHSVLDAMGSPRLPEINQMFPLRGTQETLIQMSREVQQDLLNGEEYRWKSVFLESLWEDMVKSEQLPPLQECFPDFGSESINLQGEFLSSRKLHDLVKDHGLVLIHPRYFRRNHLLSLEYRRTWTEEWINWISRWNQIDVDGILYPAVVRTNARLLTEVLTDGKFADLSKDLSTTNFDFLWETIERLVHNEDADQILETLLVALFESAEADVVVISETRKAVLEAGGFDAQSVPLSVFPRSLVQKWREELEDGEEQEGGGTF